MIYVKILHIIAVELLAAVLLLKTAWLWLGKEMLLQRYDTLMKWAVITLFLLGFGCGLCLYVQVYQLYTPFWLKLKFACLVVSLTTGIIGSLRSNRYLLSTSVLFNLLIILIANVKPL